MEAFVQETENVRLLHIDIDAWSSAVARQHDIRSLPTLYLYRGDELVSKDKREVLQHLSNGL